MNAQIFGPGAGFGGQPQQSPYEFWVRQAPEKGKVIQRGKEKDRKPLDPPAILQLNNRQDPTFLHNPYLFVYCSLWHETENRPATLADATGDEPKPKKNEIMVGQTTSSLHRLKDLDNSERGFLVLGDLSVAITGKFRLKFDLWELSIPFQCCIHLSECITRTPFEEYEAIRESTPLSRQVSEQGIKIRLRKESRHPRGRSGIGAGQPAPSNSSANTTPLRPNQTPTGSAAFGASDPGDASDSARRQRTSDDSGSAHGGPAATTPTPYFGQGQSSAYPSYPGGPGMAPPYYGVPSPYANQYQYPFQPSYSMSPSTSYPGGRPTGQSSYGPSSYGTQPQGSYAAAGDGPGGQYLQSRSSYSAQGADQGRVYPGQDYGGRAQTQTSYGSSSYPTSLPSLTSSTGMSATSGTPHLAPISGGDPSQAQGQGQGHGQQHGYGAGYHYQNQPPSH